LFIVPNGYEGTNLIDRGQFNACIYTLDTFQVSIITELLLRSPASRANADDRERACACVRVRGECLDQGMVRDHHFLALYSVFLPRENVWLEVHLTSTHWGGCLVHANNAIDTFTDHSRRHAAPGMDPRGTATHTARCALASLQCTLRVWHSRLLI
jgi:hypothetical protein